MQDSFTLTLSRDGDFRFSVEFDMPDVEPLRVDEPPPVGDGTGPNPARLLAASVGSCLSASLLFCLGKARIEPAGFWQSVTGSLRQGESTEAAARRELREETGLEAAPADLGTCRDFEIFPETR